MDLEQGMKIRRNVRKLAEGARTAARRDGSRLPGVAIFYQAAVATRVKSWGRHFAAYVYGLAGIRPSTP